MKTRSWLELYVPRNASDVFEEDGLGISTEHVLKLSFDAELVGRIYPLDGHRQTIRRHPLPSSFTLVTWACDATAHADSNQTPLYYVKAGDIAAIALGYRPSNVLDRATLAYFGGLPADYPVIPLLYHRTDQQY